MVKEALALSQSIIAKLKENGICKLEITARVAQDKMVFGDPDSFCGTSPYDGSELASLIPLLTNFKKTPNERLMMLPVLWATAFRERL